MIKDYLSGQKFTFQSGDCLFCGVFVLALSVGMEIGGGIEKSLEVFFNQQNSVLYLWLQCAKSLMVSLLPFPSLKFCDGV